MYILGAFCMVIVLFDKFTMQETSHKMHLRIMSPKEILSFVTIALLQTDFWAQSLRGLCGIKFYQMELVQNGVPVINVGWPKPRHVSIYILFYVFVIEKMIY